MTVDTRLAAALDRLPDYLGSHVLVSVTALAIGLGISLPLALFAVRRPALRAGTLAFASIVQTIPGLALLALFYPLLLALSDLCERIFGAGFSALGFLPSVLALALYSMLPVLRNTVTGLAGIDPSLREAASLFGAGQWQSMRDIELPLAMPVIMAGVRTSAVWVIGTATLSTPIGQTSLGNYIFAGLQTQNWVFVLFGCVAAAMLALVVDQLLASIEHGVAGRSRIRVGIGCIGLIVVVLGALFPAYSRVQATYVVGTKPFTEQYVLAALIQQRLQAHRLSSRRRDGLGSSVIFDALAANELDVYVDYTGTLWADEMHRTDTKAGAETLTEIGDWLRQTKGIRLLGRLGFENAYALAMTRKKAEALRVRSIADLALHAPKLSIAGDYEFFERPEWKAIRDAYGLDFKAQRTMQPDFMYAALANGDVDVASVYTSDGRIAQYDLKVLNDPKQAIPSYDAVVLLSPRRADDERLIAALKPLIGAIPVDLMREANLRASTKDTLPKDVAAWLWQAVKNRKK